MSARRRHGRFRRWLVRPFFWGLALAVALVAAAVGVAESDWFAARAARAIEAWVGERLDREVTIGGLDLDLLPLAAIATDLTVAGLPGDPPFLTAERVVVAADLTTVARPELVLRRIAIERPVIDLRVLAEGGNLPRWRGKRRPGSGGRLLSVLVGQVEIDRGEVWLEDRRVPLELAARGVEGHLFGLEARVMEGRLGAEEVEIALRSAEPYFVRVAVNGRFEPGRVEFSSGRIDGPDLFAVVRGALTWGEERRLALEIDARARAELLERLEILDAGMRGAMRFDGGLVWTPEAWGYRGTVRSPSLELLDRQVTEAVAVVSGDPYGVAVDIETATYGAGGLSGTVAYRQEEPGRPVELELDFDRVRLTRLLADQQIPVEGVDGRVSGTLSYRFEAGASRSGDGLAEFTIAPGGAPEALQLSGVATLAIEDGVLESRALRLVSAAQRVLAEGRFDLESGVGVFDYRIDSDRVAELVRLLPLPPAAPGAPPALWAPTAGHGRIDGTLEIEPGGVSTEVVFDLAEVDAPGYTAGTLRGPLAVSSAGVERMRLELSRPDGALVVSGTIPFAATLPASPAPPASPTQAPAAAVDGIVLGVDAAGWPLADLAPWLPFASPFAGDLSGSLELGGVLEALVGEVAVTLTPVTWGALEADSLALEASFDRDRVEIKRAVMTAAAGQLEAGGGFGRDGLALDLQLAARELDLARAPLAGLLPETLVGGLSVDGRLRGSFERPELELEMAASELALGGRRVGREGRGSAHLDWDGESLTARARLPGAATLAGGGTASAAGIDLDFEVASADLGPLAALLLPPEAGEVEGLAEGRLHVEGPAPEQLVARLELGRLEARRQGLELANLEPVVVEVDGQFVTIESLYLGVPDSTAELFVAGSVGLGGEHALDLKVQSTLATEWAELAVPAARLRGGDFDLIASVRGTVAAPSVNGVGRLYGTRLLVPSPPLAFEDLEATVLFYPDRVVIDRATARVAGGSVRAAGNLSLANGWLAPTYRFQFSAADLDLRYPEGWLVRGDAEVQLSSTPEGRSLQGTVTLDRAIYVERVEVGVASLIQALFDRRRIEVGETDEILASTQLNLAVRGPEALRVRNNLADLTGDIEFTLRGSLARPVVFGLVELDPGGTLVYSGLDYTIQRGQLAFANPYRIEPIVDLVATADLKEYDVVLTLAGSPERLSASFASDPPLADLEIFALLGGGAPSSGRLASASDSQSAAAEGFLYGQATSLVTERVNRLFGLDRFRIDPLTGSSGDLSSARVTVGERLSRDLFATYSYDPSTTEQQILQLEWSVSRSLVLVLTQNGDDSYAVDVRWEKAF